MAFFPANASYPGILGEMYSAAFTAPAFNWLCSPAVTELETVVLDWVAKALALPECFLSEGTGGGVIQGSASEAVVTVMVAARERVFTKLTEGLGEPGSKEVEEGKDALRGKLVALGSEQSHSSTQKGALIAGTKFRTVPAYRKDQFGVRGATLRASLEECTRDGLVPYYLTVTLGTTGTCAVDYFEEIAEVLKEYPNVWVHVDAAYAGAALICPEHQHHAQHFGAFDSFNFNMHKWLLTNFDASCLYIKTRRDLTSALSITPSYLRNSFSDSGLVTDYRDWQIPLGRRFRALKIWFVLRSYGISGLQSHIRHHISLGVLFHSLIMSRADLFDVLAGPSFALTVITIKPRRKQRRTSAANPDPDHERYLNDFTPDAGSQALVDANRVTKEVYEIVNMRGEIFLTSSVIAGIYAIRIVSATPTAEEKYLRRAFEILVGVAEEVLDREEGVGKATAT
jgi:aromatic-L-amino-acid decarboxylase